MTDVTERIEELVDHMRDIAHTDEGIACLDCRWHRGEMGKEEDVLWSEHYPSFCAHWVPEDHVDPPRDEDETMMTTYEWKRNWGDAAVMNWPFIEALHGVPRESREDIEMGTYRVLAPFFLRRPLDFDYKNDPDVYAYFGGSY